jgi:hypothetical protein
LTGETCGDYVGATATTYYMTVSTILNGNILYTDEAFTTLASDGYYYEDTYAVYRVTGGTGMVLGTNFCNTCDCIGYISSGGTFTVGYDDCSGFAQQIESYDDGDGYWSVNVCGSNPFVVSGSVPYYSAVTTNCVPSPIGQSCNDETNCVCWDATGTTGSTLSYFDCYGVYQDLNFDDYGGQIYSFCSLTTPVITGTGELFNQGAGFCYNGGGPGGGWGCAV